MKFTLRTRIYLSMITLILVSFVLTGITAFFDFKKQNEEYHQKRFERKEEAVKQSMGYFLQSKGGYIHPDSVSKVFTDKICELSDVHNLAINLFGLKGDLLISSVFEASGQNKAPDHLEYTIFKQLASGYEKSVLERDIDGTPHILDYWYFLDAANKPIAIVNVVYEKADINRSDLQAFFINLSEVYLFLFIGASILAFILSNYITKSLQHIGKKMQDVHIASANEPLKWDSDDEIGALVKEYNRMLLEVEQSAERMAKSERESAWREMAKQVAHEIKNPLTPMKLRIQYLQRAWDDGAEDMDQRMSETSNALIEQIDTLSSIANEFSNFAQMPKTALAETDLEEVLRAVMELFSIEGPVLSFSNESQEKSLIIADREQLIRVFNNLIKNARQSIPEGREGKIGVILRDRGNAFEVEIRDNGIGIPKTEEERIFVPNFTTKSTGTGLGLAMVEQIVKNAGGSVWFNSIPNEGTSFFVSWPKSH